MEFSLDLGDVITGLIALVTAIAAMRERRKKRLSNRSEQVSSKTSIGRRLSDSDCIRLSALWDSSEREEIRNKKRDRSK